MRGVGSLLCVSLSFLACAKPEAPKEAPDESADLAPQTITTTTAEPQPTPAAKPAPTLPPTTEVAAPSSPFLVQPNPTGASTNEQPTPTPTTTPPPPLPSPTPAPTPTTGGWVPTTAKPCPTGKCFANGRCVIPGGPIAREGAPDGSVSGLCGGDGGRCHPCRCVSPETTIATPNGEQPIEELRTGDLVWSLQNGKTKVVPILATQKVRVKNHSMAQVQLKNGFVVEISGDHPLADGRRLWELLPGEKLSDTSVETLVQVPYEGMFTYDILPDSDSGVYFVHGLWLGSTMFGQHVQGDAASY